MHARFNVKDKVMKCETEIKTKTINAHNGGKKWIKILIWMSNNKLFLHSLKAQKFSWIRLRYVKKLWRLERFVYEFNRENLRRFS